MKKVIAILMSMALILGLTACGSQSSEDSGGSGISDAQESVVSEAEETENTNASEESENTDTEEAVGEEETDTGSSVLVVYYSATGSTERAASYIADALDADIFELEPVDPYTDEELDYTNRNSRVSQEYNNNERDVELVSVTVESWDQYDTVLIGYPIWWHIAAWPVNEFVQSNDFTGKTVIPFCTSGSSGLGESGELLEEMAGSGTWLEGQRFSSGASEDSVREWALGLGLTE